jgi:hypothetical protein
MRSVSRPQPTADPTPTPASPQLMDALAARLLGEGAISISQAAKLYPRVRQNKPASPVTVFRHITDGITLPDGRTLKLEACRWIGRWITSPAAVTRFLAAQNTEPVGNGRRSEVALPRTPSRRQRESARAARQLEKAGI